MSWLVRIWLLNMSLFLILINGLKMHSHNQSGNVTYIDLKNKLGQTIDYKYYDNLYSPIANFYYGSITKQSYDMRIKLYKIDDYQICNQATPYATLDMQSCTICPLDKPLFNLGTRQCQRCKSHLTQKCDTILNITQDTKTLNPQNNITQNTTTSNPQINLTTPFNNNQSTNNKNNGTSTNNQSLNTTNTSTNNITNNNSPHIIIWQPKKNITTQNTTVSNIKNSTIIVQLLPVGENGKEVKSQIIKTQSQYRVVQNKTNQKKNSSTVQSVIAPTKSDNVKFANEQCPKNIPFYNSITKNCETCKQNQEYVPNQRKCLPIIYMSNKLNKNVILISTDQLLKANNNIKGRNLDRLVKECSLEKPFIINNTCIACGQAQIFNFAKQQCQNGCSQGQIFSPLQSKCIDATFITNPDAQSLFSPISDFEIFRADQKAKASSSGGIVYCPINKPFMIDGRCLGCSSQAPLFNIASKKCESCSKNRNYDSFKRKCVTDFEPSLQVSKMIPNIF